MLLSLVYPELGPRLPPSFSTGLSQYFVSPKPFRINTYKSLTKQTPLTAFRMNTCGKSGGRGVPRSLFLPTIHNPQPPTHCGSYPLALAFNCFASFSISSVFLYIRTDS